MLIFDMNDRSDSIFQVHLAEPVLSERRDLLEQLLDFYEPDVLPATQPVIVSFGEC